MRNIRAILILLLSVLLSSCMTMNKRECQAGEWQSAGAEDARRGLTDRRFESHAKACAKHGISPDKALYSEGYNEGLLSYCTQDNGMRQGENSNEYQGICPAETEKVFLRGYLAGLENRLDAIDRRYYELSGKLNIARSRQLRAETSEDIQRYDQIIRNIETAILKVRSERNDVTSAISRWLGQAIR